MVQSSKLLKSNSLSGRSLLVVFIRVRHFNRADVFLCVCFKFRVDALRRSGKWLLRLRLWHTVRFHRLAERFLYFFRSFDSPCCDLESFGGTAAQITLAFAVAPASADHARVGPLRILTQGESFREQYETGRDDILGGDLRSLVVEIIGGIDHQVVQGNLRVDIRVKFRRHGWFGHVSSLESYRIFTDQFDLAASWTNWFCTPQPNRILSRNAMALLPINAAR